MQYHCESKTFVETLKKAVELLQAADDFLVDQPNRAGVEAFAAADAGAPSSTVSKVDSSDARLGAEIDAFMARGGHVKPEADEEGGSGSDELMEDPIGSLFPGVYGFRV